MLHVTNVDIFAVTFWVAILDTATPEGTGAIGFKTDTEAQEAVMARASTAETSTVPVFSQGVDRW